MSMPPALHLEFVHSALIDPRLNFARASTGTYIDRDGVLKTAQVNEPRIGYNPLTRERRGLLIEGARTNLALRSQELDNAAWTKSACSITANAASAPQGVVIADKIVEAASSVRHYVAQSIAYTAGQDYCWSSMLKRSERKRARVRLPSGQFSASAFVDVDLSTGAVIATGAGAVRGDCWPMGNGWYRAWVVTTATATASGNAEVEMLDDLSASAYAGDGASGLYAVNMQCEIGAYPSSYIPTVLGTVSRAPDIATYPFASLAYNADACGLVAEWVADHAYPSQAGVTQSYFVATLSDGSSSNYIRLMTDIGGLPRVVVRAAAATQATLTGAALGTGTLGKASAGVQKDSIVAAFSAAAVQTDMAADMPAGVNQITLGVSETSGAQTYLDGYLRRLLFFNSRPSDAEIQAMAA
ncbi:phage head spike fiber domain-containing protein [Zavarzinia sp.]|uniref:phage head spike fiber domain-containing protein n=1 Tax=Zavarzinia sp. TaxID=2027920 RepID=UPI003BB4E2C4